MATRDASGLTYQGSDALSTPVAAVNASTGVVGEQLFAPYGQARYGASAPTNGGLHTTLGFTGQHTDTGYPGASGLDYFGARYLDPVVGRFTTADDTEPGLGDPVGMDPYAYVDRAVESATDPSGHWPKNSREWRNWITGLSLALLGAITQRPGDIQPGANTAGTGLEDKRPAVTAPSGGVAASGSGDGGCGPDLHNEVFPILVEKKGCEPSESSASSEPGQQPDEESDQTAAGNDGGDGLTDSGGATTTTTQNNGSAGPTIVPPPGGSGATGPTTGTGGGTGAGSGAGQGAGTTPTGAPDPGLRDSTPGWIRYLQEAGLPVGTVLAIIDAVVKRGAVPPAAGTPAAGESGPVDVGVPTIATPVPGNEGGGDGGDGVGVGLPGNGAGVPAPWNEDGGDGDGGGGYQFL